MNAALVPYLKEENDSMERKNKGTSFDSWLDEEGIREEVVAAATKRVLTRRTAAAMKRDGIAKAEMALEDAYPPQHSRPLAGRGKQVRRKSPLCSS